MHQFKKKWKRKQGEAGWGLLSQTFLCKQQVSQLSLNMY